MTLDRHIENEARRFGASLALAKDIMFCESSNDPNATNDNVKGGVVWSTDRGLWQINDYYHEEDALKMGLDIYNDFDNITYGFHLLSTQGTTPWNASKHCWSHA